MYRDKYFRLWEGPFHFDLLKISGEAPPAYGVYQVLRKTGNNFDVMYIGIATGTTIKQRLTSHWAGIGNKNIREIGNTANFYFVFWVCDFQSAKQIESFVITTEKPPFNVKNEFKHYIPNITVH
jgi:hypothetical protein